MKDVKSLMIFPRMNNWHLCASFLFERQFLTKRESESLIRTCMPVAERGKLLCSHIMGECPVENAIKSSAKQISTSAPVAIGYFFICIY